MLKVLQSPIPKAVIVPQMATTDASRRQKSMINLYRSLCRVLEGESYVGLSHLLPHYSVRILG